MAELDEFLGAVLDDKYRLEKLLGKGGMGAVFLATHLGTERPVAVKVITPRLMQNEEFVRRFSREAKAAGRLRHPNVVDVTDFGVAHTPHGPLAYLVMEYLDGCTLGDILAEEKQLPLEWVTDIMEQTCSAVHEAHQQGIVHRDLKPDNIWLEPNRLGGYRVKVLDFGLAKLAAPSLSGPAAVASSGSSPDSGNNARPSGAGTAAALKPTLADDEALTADHSANEAATAFRPAPETGARPPKANLEAVTQEREGEAATLAWPPADDSEAATREFSAAAVALQAIKSLDKSREQPTRIFQAGTPEPAHSTTLDSNVTRIGAIIGTPLYMSPEQCRGEKLSLATDVYSLGVIAYQMLTGETPFTGNSLHVLRQHREDAPPSLQEKNRKVPRKVARLVMSALAKDPAQRPASAAAFASMLRARADGAGPLLRHALALFSEYFMPLIKVSLLAHLPLLGLLSLSFINDGLRKWNFIGQTFGQVVNGVLGFLTVIMQLVTASVITGVTVLVVIQLFVAPLRPVRARQALNLVRPKLRQLIWTSLLIFIFWGAGLIYPFPPLLTGVALLILFTLYAPVILIEDLSGRRALQRSAQLVLQAVGIVVFITLIQWLIPVLASVIFQRLAGGLQTTNAYRVEAVGRLANLLNIFIMPLVATINALLYLRVREAVGEPVKQMLLDQFDAAEMPTSRWQQRMRERLAVSGSSNRTS